MKLSFIGSIALALVLALVFVSVFVQDDLSSAAAGTIYVDAGNGTVNYEVGVLEGGTNSDDDCGIVVTDINGDDDQARRVATQADGFS